MKMKGIPASDGIGIGNAVPYQGAVPNIIRKKTTNAGDEILKYSKAREIVFKQLLSDIENAHSDTEKELLEAHIMMLMDEETERQILSKIQDNQLSASWAVEEVLNEYIEIFKNMDDEYLSARGADVLDIKIKLLLAIDAKEINPFSDVSQNSILIAADLLPSELISLKEKNPAGIILDQGNATSHVAILSKTMSIPMVVGAKGILDQVLPEQKIILDGSTGEYILSPTESEENLYRQKAVEKEAEKVLLQNMVGKKTITPDGKEIHLLANIGRPEDVSFAIENDAEGVGLFRTEFLFMERQDMPSEEEQYHAYKSVAEAFAGKPVIIRTLDAGGDKKIDYLNIPHEENPFLGYRAIRLCINQPEVFLPQLRAILRASVGGNVKIMFPMIASLSELQKAKDILDEAKKSLDALGITYDKQIEVGVMIETPSAAVISDLLAVESDFFSIGTNDLIQYTMAADRMNSQVHYLYNAFEPAVLRLIKLIIDNAHERKIKVGICGEAGSNTEMVRYLVDYGIDDISMSAGNILKTRSIIHNLSNT